MRIRLAACYLVAIATALVLPTQAVAQSFLDQDAEAALQTLYSRSSVAKTLAEKATAVLVFSSMTKAGFLVGTQAGEGTLFQKGQPVAHYSAGGATLGWQAGVQTYAYALFFMTAADLAYLNRSGGWSVGLGPNFVVVDAGSAADVSTTTARNGVYAFIFEQKGLMAGVGIVGQKISRIR